MHQVPLCPLSFFLSFYLVAASLIRVRGEDTRILEEVLTNDWTLDTRGTGALETHEEDCYGNRMSSFPPKANVTSNSCSTPLNNTDSPKFQEPGNIPSAQIYVVFKRVATRSRAGKFRWRGWSHAIRWKENHRCALEN